MYILLNRTKAVFYLGKRQEVLMTAAVSTIKHHEIHEIFTILSRSCIPALKGSFFFIECVIGIAILASVLLFVVVVLSFLLYSILF